MTGFLSVFKMLLAEFTAFWFTMTTDNSLDVSVYRVPHLLCCRALEVQKVVCAPDALQLRHPVNAYNEVV